MSSITTAPSAPVIADVDAEEPTITPCVARPGFRHVGMPCQCFFGGPSPEFAPSAGVAPV